MAPFRFGVIAAPRGTGDAWRATARRVVDRGFSTLLVPDTTALHDPFPALAAAAAWEPTLRVGTFVLAAPTRAPAATARTARSLTELTGGRFDLGIGTGRPDARAEVEAVGRPWGSAAERLDVVRRTLAELRDRDGDDRTPVLVAAGGPRSRALAAEHADVVALATAPTTPRAEVAGIVADLRARAGDRDPTIALNLAVVGDVVPPGAARWLGTDPTRLDPRESLAVLRGSPREMADELERRREGLGVSYLVVDVSALDVLAPVAALLAGR